MIPIYFKVKTGVMDDDYIEINEDELERAHTCVAGRKMFIGSRGTFTVSDTKSISIVPDFARMLGLPRMSKLTFSDYEELDRNGATKRAYAHMDAVKRKLRGEPAALEQKNPTEEDKGLFYVDSVFSINHAEKNDNDVVLLKNIATGKGMKITRKEAVLMKAQGTIVEKPKLEEEKSE
jgi:hypothetical protein